MNELNDHIKIAVLGTRGFPDVQGGVETCCERLYSYLTKRGCNIVVLARKPYVGSQSYVYNDINIIPLSCPRNKYLEAILHTFYGVLYTARNIRPDILHIHTIGPSLCVPLARMLGMKVVITTHGADYKRKKWGWFPRLMLRIGEYLGVKYSNAIICVSEAIVNDIESKYNRESIVIPNGIDIPAIHQQTDILNIYGIKKQKYILAVGRFVPEKGFHDLIDAFNKTKMNSDWKLIIVGSASHQDKYSLFITEKAKSYKNIMLTGEVYGTTLQELYSHAGLFVLPSYHEGLSSVLLEALSYRLSCIVSDIPANRIIPLAQNRYFKAGDVEMIASKIKEFVEKPMTEEEKLKYLNILKQEYNWEKIADETLKVYKEVAYSTIFPAVVENIRNKGFSNLPFRKHNASKPN